MDVVCEVKSSGPYLTSFSYKFLEACKITIKRHKFVGGYFESPDDFSSWKNKYVITNLGEFDIKENDIIDINNKFSYDINKPLQIGDIIFDEGTSSDKYLIHSDTICKYDTINSEFVDH